MSEPIQTTVTDQSSQTQSPTARDWIPVCNGHGEILYWIAIDGERRTVTPPRAEWSPEMDGYEIGQ